jgi:hypothetical protein
MAQMSLYLHGKMKLLRGKRRCRMFRVENSENGRREGETQTREDVCCARRRREKLIYF